MFDAVPTPVIAAAVFALGTVLGSFLQTIVDRHHREVSWVTGRSRCDRCRATLTWRELIPLVSFLWLRGRCRSCRKPIAIWHFLAELLLGTLYLLVYLYPFGIGVAFVPAQLLLVSLLFILFMYDLRYGELPDQFTLPSIAAAAVLAFFSGQSLIGVAGAALLGGAFFLVQYLVSRGRWVGSGDARLGFLLGLIVGWPYILVAFFVAYVGGSLVSLVLIASHIKKLKDQVPMGAFLIPAALFTLWFGERLIALVWY